MRKFSYISFICSMFLLALFSCGEDRTHEYKEMTKENQWIYSTMKDVYLWGDSIKKPSQKDFFQTTNKFFNSILVAGDNVSFFTDTVAQSSYGFIFANMRDPLGERPSKVYSLVLYVEPGSPADIAGLKRGTWISAVGGKALTLSTSNLLSFGNGTEVVTEYIDSDEENYFWVSSDTLTIPASVDITPAAIPFDSVYSLREKRIGYLLCNSFHGEGFLEESKRVLSGFRSAEVTDIVIDLRYNNGGSLRNAALLASALVPDASIGTTFCSLKGRNSISDTTYLYEEQPYSFGDKNIYIITGEATTGVAQLFVQSLNATRSMYELMVIGEEGSSAVVYTETISSPYGFAINPAVAYIHNAQGDRLSSTGIAVDYALQELADIKHIKPLGDQQEYMLYNTTYLIVNGTLPVAHNRARECFLSPFGPRLVEK